MEELIKDAKRFEETLNIKNIFGANVLSSLGAIIGKVKQVRINPSTMKIEGIFAKGGFLSKGVYISREYISSITNDSVILSVEPAFLFIHRKVYGFSGESLGRVKEVERVEKTNTIKSIIVHSLLRGSFKVPSSSIESISSSIILKSSYNAPKTRFSRKA